MSNPNPQLPATCPTCKGEGEVWNMTGAPFPKKLCPTCHGTGKVPSDEASNEEVVQFALYGKTEFHKAAEAPHTVPCEVCDTTGHTPEASEGKPEYCDARGCIRMVFPPYIYCDKHQDKSSTPPTPSALPNACPHCWNGKLKKRLESTGEIELVNCTYCDGTGVEAQPQESVEITMTGEVIKSLLDRGILSPYGLDVYIAKLLAAEYTRGELVGLYWSAEVVENYPSRQFSAIKIRDRIKELQQLTKEPK